MQRCWHTLLGQYLFNGVFRLTNNYVRGDNIRIEYFDTLMSYADAFSLVSEFYTDKKKAVVGSESFKSGRSSAEGRVVFS